jgi:hypothetical protein
VCLSFAAKDHDLEGPRTGPDFLSLPHLKTIKSGKGDALRKEQGLFCILFVAAWTKRMASGGTRPAGYALILKVKSNRLTSYYPLFITDHRSKTKLCQQPERPGITANPFPVTPDTNKPRNSRQSPSQDFSFAVS